MTDVKSPADHYKVNYNGKEHELFMSYGLLNELVQIVQDLGAIGTISVSTDLRNQVLRALLSERDVDGNITKEIKPFGLNITNAELQRLVKWVQEHLLDFFIGALEISMEAHRPYQDRLTATLTPSGNGTSA